MTSEEAVEDGPTAAGAVQVRVIGALDARVAQTLPVLDELVCGEHVGQAPLRLVLVGVPCPAVSIPHVHDRKEHDSGKKEQPSLLLIPTDHATAQEQRQNQAKELDGDRDDPELGHVDGNTAHRLLGPSIHCHVVQQLLVSLDL